VGGSSFKQPQNHHSILPVQEDFSFKIKNWGNKKPALFQLFGKLAQKLWAILYCKARKLSDENA